MSTSSRMSPQISIEDPFPSNALPLCCRGRCPPSALSLSMRNWPALKFDRGYCLARAAECERQALDNPIPFLREVLLSLAEKWRKAAEESDAATANSQKQ